MKVTDARRMTQAVHNQLIAFEATARLGSFRSAADELFVTQGAVAQQVRVMEEKLGMKLFTRLPRGLAPTPVAQDYVNRVRLAMGIIEEATRVLLHTGSENDPYRLTLSTTAAFASRWLLPRLARLTEQHPRISIMIDATDVTRPLKGPSSVDMAIRWGAPPFLDTAARFLLPGRSIAVCSPTLSGYGGWQRPRDVLNVPLISDTHNNWTRWFDAYGLPGARFSGPSFSQANLALDAAEQGMGIALIPEPLATPSLKTGALTRAFAGAYPLETEHGFYVVTAEPITPDSAISTVVTWLLSEVDARTGLK
ncbi:LysR family transcriptional regulator [Pseudomonas putida]|uniref:LysR family transcriptional regulator n=1 Tax=Pseudomonas putida TaxID=303 RepID=A0AA37VWN2_PSEPU|nr:LysR substrate-binding domain-containing protein [Pseudomonas putida]GLO15538.1 LysR family transcriptional regulator [Pseudomonas putida]GLO37070.1 LysR family transcriptional regulator [Pseudomonas putida]HDS0965443.1 LysR family transcriptional regulator [Pseudomonas putida]HDS0992705.1 LysR family transcriptional regulator [Pseudomonas putida]